MEDGPANNLRKTPGRAAIKASEMQGQVKGYIKDKKSGKILELGEEDNSVDTKCARKIKHRRPTSKRPNLLASQTLMKNYLKQKVEDTTFFLSSVEIAGYETDPGTLTESSKQHEQKRRNSVDSLTNTVSTSKIRSRSSVTSLEDYTDYQSAVSHNSIDSAEDGIRNENMNSRNIRGQSDVTSPATLVTIDRARQQTIAMGVLDGQLSGLTPEQINRENQERCAFNDIPNVQLTEGNNKQTVREHNDKCLIADCNLGQGQVLEKQYVNANISGGVYALHDSAYKKASRVDGQHNISVIGATCTTTSATTTTMATQMAANVTTTFASSKQLLGQSWLSNQTWGVPKLSGHANMSQDMTVTKMFTSLSTQIAGIATGMRAMQTEVHNLNDKLEGAFFEMENQQQVIDETVEKHNLCSDQVEMLTNVAIQQERQLENLKVQIDNMERQAGQNNLLIYGIQEMEEDCMESVKDFIKLKLEYATEVEILDAYRMGSGKNRPIKIKLKDRSDKSTIFKHAKNLKGKKNELDKAYFIQNDLPEGLQEAERWQRQIFSKNKRSVANKLVMSFKRNHLQIQNQPYQKLAPAPKSRDLLHMSPADRLAVQQARLVSTKER